MSNISYVGIAEYKIISAPGILACSALGSCVAVCLWDSENKLAGLIHILLPSINNSTNKTNLAKFADYGIEKMVRDMEKQGATRKKLRAKLVGGANLYHYEHACAASEIGGRNIEAARAVLKVLKIPVVAEHVGGKLGCSVRYNPENFEVRVNIFSQGMIII